MRQSRLHIVIGLALSLIVYHLYFRNTFKNNTKTPLLVQAGKQHILIVNGGENFGLAAHLASHLVRSQNHAVTLWSSYGAPTELSGHPSFMHAMAFQEPSAALLAAIPAVDTVIIVLQLPSLMLGTLQMEQPTC